MTSKKDKRIYVVEHFEYRPLSDLVEKALEKANRASVNYSGGKRKNQKRKPSHLKKHK
jgi:hypothetical protein